MNSISPFRLPFAVAGAACLLSIGSAFAQPIFLVGQNRSVGASGHCCGVPGQSDSFIQTGLDAVFNHTIPNIGFSQDQYNYYYCSASQTSQIDPDRIFGTLGAGAGARGLTNQASSFGVSTCEVTFDLGVRATYLFTSNDRGNYFGGNPVARLEHDGISIFDFRMNNPSGRSYTRSGTLAPGRYSLHVDCSASGTQFSSVVSCDFNFVVASNCACDWNHDDRLDSADFFAFLADFFEVNADYNHSGLTDSADFFDFLACFFTTCA